MAEHAQVPGGVLFRDGGQALAASEVGGVDESPQFVCDLAWPDRIGVGLGGVLKIAQQVGYARLMRDASEAEFWYRSWTMTVPCRSL